MTYNLSVSVTNVSYSKNTFKVLPLSDDVRDYFDIQYKFPGHIRLTPTAVVGKPADGARLPAASSSRQSEQSNAPGLR